MLDQNFEFLDSNEYSDYEIEGFRSKTLSYSP